MMKLVRIQLSSLNDETSESIIAHERSNYTDS